MTSQTGKPFQDGRYVVWVETADSAGWLQPFITLWHDGEWRYRESTAKFHGAKIHAWAGPIPPLKVSEVQQEAEYDL